MTFESPTPLAEAIRLLLGKRLVPTALSSAELRELAAEVKNAALFSARMTQIRPLAVLQQVLEEMLRGNANMADAKLALGKVYEAMGYNAEAGGFPQDVPGTVPPALSGSLRDLASQERMALTIETNYRMVTNAAFVAEATANEDAIYHFPCFELRRTRGRRTPRGFVRRKGGMEVKPGDDWPSRWVAAGGELFDRGTRMIAAKDSPVWQALGEGAGGYTDTLGNPFPPFAWGSGMGLREISRTEALLLGVITEEDEIAKMPVTMAKALQADAKNVPPEILEAFGDDLEEDLGRIQRRQARRAAVEAARNRRLAWLADMLANAGRRSKRIRRDTRAPKVRRDFNEDEWVRVGGQFAGYTGPRRTDTVKDMLGKLKDNPAAELTAHVMMLDGRVAARLSKAFGRDVRGWELVLDANHYRHAMAGHADEVRDQWGKLPQILAQADHIIPSKEKTRSGEKGVEVWRQDGSWLKLVLIEGGDKKVKVKTFKRRKELFNRLFGRGGPWTASARLSRASGALTSETTQGLTGDRGNAARSRIHTPEAFLPPQGKFATPRARCKLFAELLQKGGIS